MDGLSHPPLRLAQREEDVMKRSKFVSGAVTLAGLVAVLLLLPREEIQGQPGRRPRAVEVVNGPRHPVPVVAAGATRVEGTVAAEQAGDWQVALSGVPTVLVGNAPEQAVPVHCVDAVEPELIQFMLSFDDMPAGEQNSWQSFDVPAGKRLLIDYVTARVVLPAGQRGKIQITTTPAYADYQGVQHHFSLTPDGSNLSSAPGTESHTLSQETRIFGEGTISIVLTRGPAPSPTGLGGGRVSITGRLVDAPG